MACILTSVLLELCSFKYYFFLFFFFTVTIHKLKIVCIWTWEQNQFPHSHPLNMDMLVFYQASTVISTTGRGSDCMLASGAIFDTMVFWKAWEGHAVINTLFFCAVSHAVTDMTQYGILGWKKDLLCYSEKADHKGVWREFLSSKIPIWHLSWWTEGLAVRQEARWAQHTEGYALPTQGTEYSQWHTTMWCCVFSSTWVHVPPSQEIFPKHCFMLIRTMMDELHLYLKSRFINWAIPLLLTVNRIVTLDQS